MKKTLALFYFLAFIIGAEAQVKPKLAKEKKPSKATIIPLDTAIRTGKLANGFTYYIRRNVEPKDRVQLYLAMKVGSILENDDQRGLAHFVEHMSFNGTKNYPKNDLVNYLQKSGVKFGADLNAYTSFDETVYQLPLPTDDPELLQNGFKIMRDWAQNATLDSLEIEKERGVVLEEKRSGKGAQERMQNKYLPVLLNGSRYANRLPIGIEDVLKNFSHQTIKQFYKDWYRPNLQALIVVGDINVNQVEQLIKSNFSDLKNPDKARSRTVYNIPLLNKNQFIAVTDKEFPYTVVQIMAKHPESKLLTTTDLRNATIRTLYNEMMGERFGDLMKQANPPFLQASNNISGFLAGLDIAATAIVTKPGELEKGVKTALAETEKVKLFGFTQTELDRAKRSYLTSMEAAYKERDKTSSANYVREYTRLFLKDEASPGIAYEYNFAKDVTSGITLAEVNALAKTYLVDTNRDVLIMAPESQAETLPSEATINTWINETKNEKLTAYVDEVSDKPLLAEKPAAGKVTAEKKIEEIGVTELMLSNGVKVVLKPTDFKNDEITFNSFSPGGTSLYSDADYQSATFASYVVSQGGVAEFSSIQLPKMLTGKRVSVNPYISERTEGINGFAAPQDLETALQLVYLYFTQPRKDQDIFQSIISQQKGILQNRGSDPASVFSDTVSAVLGNYNIRRTGPSLSKLESVSLDRAFEIYKERFANAGDFTFTFVGSFKVEEIKPLIEQYLGALPNINRVETAKDLGIKPPSGKIVKNVYKGQEPKATVRLVFSGNYSYNEDTNNQLQALGEVIQIKLIERLREEESGVYSPGTNMSYVKYPSNRYSFTVAFGCSPENVDKLVAATLDEINKIKQKGAEAGDIEKFLAEERRSTETQLKQNGFWASYLTGQYVNNESPKQMLGYLDSLKKITPQSLKETANNYLSGENLIKLVLLPENK